MAANGYPNDYRDQVRANVDKAPALTARKRAALRVLLHPGTVEDSRAGTVAKAA